MFPKNPTKRVFYENNKKRKKRFYIYGITNPLLFFYNPQLAYHFLKYYEPMFFLTWQDLRDNLLD